MHQLPESASQSALGWVQHTVRPLLRAADPVGQANEGGARGDVCRNCIASSDHPIEGARVAGVEVDGCANCHRQAKAGDRPMTRVHAARQLLAHGPLSMGAFIAITGWSRVQARKTVSHMSEVGLIKPVNVAGQRCHALADSPVSTHKTMSKEA